VKRDEQIELLVNASKRKEARAQAWLKNEKVRSFIREFHDQTLALKLPPRAGKKACG